MSKAGKLLFKLLPLYLLLLFSSCESELPDSPIPYAYVNVEINLNDIRYQILQQPNGYIYLPGGVRGIIVIADGFGNYTAFDRACPFHPAEDCALIEMHESGFYLFDDCCGSTFSLSGQPTAGPARSPLRQYNTFLNGDYLIISSE
ncbi:Rieske (2Fe-2S) protein [Nafulsella turpanensis]|uniref:hypothetical protein n=1 Tax=Nafulsella turpanensis TaxID=1265690 RepID=UPI000347DEBF|nr:hypothetical protein [Nafulsella turpanensis]